MARAKTNLTGRWSIQSMTMWDDDYINEEVPGYFDFGKKNLGVFPLRVCPGRDRLSADPAGRQARRGVLVYGF